MTTLTTNSTINTRATVTAGPQSFATIKSPAEIASMHMAGRVVADALAAASAACVPGATTQSIDDAAAQVIEAVRAESLFLNYPSYRAHEGFPGRTCISVNDVIVHGIPGARRLEDGDIVTIDCGVRRNGWCADAAITVGVGTIAETWRAMIDTAHLVLRDAIAAMRPGVSWPSIAEQMERRALADGYGVVREYYGHGIGRRLHEPPAVPAYSVTDSDTTGCFVLRPGMVLAIEPMLTLGDPSTRVDADGWTVRTRDGSPACHVEHTVAMTNDGPVILTDGR